MSGANDIIAELTASGAPFELRPTTVDGVELRCYTRSPHTLQDVLTEVRAGDDDAVYLVYGAERYSYAEHRAIVAGLANWLTDSAGVGPGDRVSIAMRNYPEFAFWFWACVAIGAIAVPLNAWWVSRELARGLNDCGAVVLACDEERLGRLRAELPRLTKLRAVVVARASGGLGPDVVSFESLRAGFDPLAELPSGTARPEDDCTILYTSGTTGLPRGAVSSHRNHCTNILNQMLVRGAAVAARGTVSQAPGGQEGLLAHMPFFHIGQLSTLYLAMSARRKIVLLYRWDVEKALDAIEQERLTTFNGVPLQVNQILDSLSVRARDLSALRTLGVGSTPVPPEMIGRIAQAFGGRINPSGGYGMTETTSAVSMIAGDEYIRHPDSVGRPTPANDIRIVGQDCLDVVEGGVGEVWVRGPNVVRRYWNDPESSAVAFTDGWYHSGDLGRLDRDGRIYLVDRIKDVIIRGGENVYSAEVEAALCEHSAVRSATVVGVPDPNLGEQVVALVETAGGAAVSAAELTGFAAERLAYFKVPSSIFLVDGELPRTSTGKVLKNAAREMAVALSSTATSLGE